MTQPLTPGLTALEARVRQDLAWLDLPSKDWVIALPHQGSDVLPVAIIGGGMAGMAASAALLQLGIKAPIFDQSPKASKARGRPRPEWRRCARPSN